MDGFRRCIETSFYILGALRDRFSEEWRRGANRRTIFISLTVGILLLTLYSRGIAPPAEFPLNQLVTVAPEQGLAELSAALEHSHVIQNQYALRIIVTALGNATSVKAGDYMFKEPLSVFAVAKTISIGAYGLEPEKIRVQEGATTKEMSLIFASRLQRIQADRFLEKAKPYEGYLFPDTYFFLPNATEDIIIAAMRDNFDAHIHELDEEITKFGKPLREIVIMASLIEREAYKSDDRRMIAGVLWNRIDKDMLLQVDAAFLYEMGKATFDLTLADLKVDSPYNTYKYKGLPPTPIGSPSLDSIRAAVTPEKHKYLFYLADNHGTTYYSRTYEEHLRKKRLYLGT